MAYLFLVESMTKRATRFIGAVYLIFFLTSILSDALLKGLVQKDAAATATNILTHEARFRLSIAAGLIETGFYVALVALFYQLFKPVNRTLSLVAAFFGLVGCAIQAGGSAFELLPLVLLRGGQAFAVFKPDELSSLALLFLKLNDQAGSVALVFFAMYCLLIGCLILGSIFLPRFLGMLMVLAGLGWLTFLYAPLADHLSPYIELLGIVAEACLMLWLLVMGVNPKRWQEQAERQRPNQAMQRTAPRPEF